MTTSLRCEFRLAMVIGCLGLFAGCQSLDLNLALMGHRPPQPSAKNPVVEVLSLWEPAEGTGLDKLPTRGFAGQILFVTPRNQEPVQVDGKVRIYVFDDQGTVEEQQQPIHQFAFDAKSWNAFLRETNLGAAYQIFIPYTRPGMHQAVCSLRICYEPLDGQSIYSKFAKVTLAGTTRPAAEHEALSALRAAVTMPKEGGARVPVEPERTVIPAAYTFENTKPSEASIRQLQARFDELLKDGGGTNAANALSEESVSPGRLRLKPAQSSASPTAAGE